MLSWMSLQLLQLMPNEHDCTLHSSIRWLPGNRCPAQATIIVNVSRPLQVLVPMIAYVAAPASGAHFNPIVTFAFMATGILVRLLCCLHVRMSTWQHWEMIYDGMIIIDLCMVDCPQAMHRWRLPG